MPARIGVGTRRMAVHGLVAAMLLSLIGLFSPVSAWAHGEGESDECFVLVRQALAYMANKPGDMMAIREKINAAVDASVKNCAKPELVSQAMGAMNGGDMMQARDLLQHSIGAGHYMGANITHVLNGTQQLTGEDTGTLAALDPIPGREGLTSRDWIVLAIAIAVGLAGVNLAFSLRPKTASESGVEEQPQEASTP